MRNAFCFFLVFSSVLYGQVTVAQTINIREIRQANPITKEIYVFPHVTVTGKKQASLKINNYLRKEMLQAEPGTPEKNMFNEVWKKDDFPPALSAMDYSISRHDNKILSLQISAEGCGAYCEPFTQYFNFNPATGNKLMLDSIFTPTGLRKLKDSVINSIRGLITAKIAEGNDSLASYHEDEEMAEYYNNMVAMYSECLSYGSFAVTDKFSLNGNHLTVYTGRCSRHADRNLDELGNFEYSIHLAAWKEDLTTFGKKLVLYSGRKNPKK